MSGRLQPRPRQSLARQHVHGEFHVHRGFQRVAVQLAVTLRRMAVAHIEQSSRHAHRQVNRHAFGHFVEIHVAAEPAGIARSRRRLRRPCRRRHASQHGMQRHRVLPQMLARLLGSGHTLLHIQVPAHILETVLHLHRQIAVHSALHDAVIADRPIAIQSQMREMHRQDIAGRRACYIERTSLRISAEHAGDALLIGPTGIHRGGVDGIARRHGQHRRIERRELAIENRRHKIVSLRPTRTWLRSTRSRKLVRHRMLLIVAIDEDDRAGDRTAGKRAGQFLGSALLVFGEEVDCAPVQCALQLVAPERARELVTLLFQFHGIADRRAIKIGGGEPFARKRGRLGQQERRYQHQQRGSIAHSVHSRRIETVEVS